MDIFYHQIVLTAASGLPVRLDPKDICSVVSAEAVGSSAVRACVNMRGADNTVEKLMVRETPDEVNKILRGQPTIAMRQLWINEIRSGRDMLIKGWQNAQDELSADMMKDFGREDERAVYAREENVRRREVIEREEDAILERQKGRTFIAGTLANIFGIKAGEDKELALLAQNKRKLRDECTDIERRVIERSRSPERAQRFQDIRARMEEVSSDQWVRDELAATMDRFRAYVSGLGIIETKQEAVSSFQRASTQSSDPSNVGYAEGRVREREAPEGMRGGPAETGRRSRDYGRER